MSPHEDGAVGRCDICSAPVARQYGEWVRLDDADATCPDGGDHRVDGAA